MSTAEALQPTANRQPATGNQWRGMFRDLPREHGFEPLRVEGRIPDDLRGVLHRIGPAQFGVGAEKYRHWFDGDGAISAVRIHGRGAEGAVRFVETDWYRDEKAARRPLYRSYAQVGKSWRRWSLPKNPANINLLPWKGQLLALWEAGFPIAVDPVTLETLGETDLGGKLRRPLSAHPHRAGGTLFNFGARYGPRFTLDLYAFEPAGVKRFASVPLPRARTPHDFIATPHYLVFFLSPVRARLARIIAGVSSFEDTLVWEPEHGTEIVIVPLRDPEHPVRFTVPASFQWHFVNAWEEGDVLVVDTIEYEDFASNEWYGRAPYDPPRPHSKSRYKRTRINPGLRTSESHMLHSMTCEFPAIHPHDVTRSHMHAWLLSFDELPATLCRFDVRSGRVRRVPLDPDAFPSEPVVVPRADNADGWVLSLVYDGASDASYVAVVDGSRPEAGTVARLWFDHAIPFPFHGAWTIA